MIIAILGWGSLIWKPQNLPLATQWKANGPKLPLEFSMIANNRKLTLVIDPLQGAVCPALFAYSSRQSLAEAIEDLREREGTSAEQIGYVDTQHQLSSVDSYPDQVNVDAIVRQWCQAHDIAAAIWTAQRSNFNEKLGVEFSVDAALKYLKQLPEADQKSALEYIRNTPAEVDTPLRQRVAAEWGT